MTSTDYKFGTWYPINLADMSAETALFFPAVYRGGRMALAAMIKIGRPSEFPFRAPTHFTPLHPTRYRKDEGMTPTDIPMTDKEMLKKILDVWVQVFACDDKDKTVGEWRHDVSIVMTDAVFYWRNKYGSEQEG